MLPTPGSLRYKAGLAAGDSIIRTQLAPRRGPLLVALAALALGACGDSPRAPAGVAAPAAPAAEPRRLNVYNWSDYIAPETIAKFERETGIRVNYDVYDGNEVLEARLLAGRSGFDVVVPSANFMERQVQAGIYRELDHALLPNLANLDPDVMRQLARHDPGNRHAVPYLWGTTGIGWNVAQVRRVLGDVPVDSWALVFDPRFASRLQSCGIGMLDAPQEVINSALIYLGRDPNADSEENLRAAEELLARVRPYVRYFNSSQYINDLANGEICIAVGWGGDVLQARDRAREANTGAEIAFVVPKEGGIVWFDVMAIPADAPHPRNAHLFIDFVLRPEIAAEISNYIRYPTPNAAAMPLVDEDVRTDPAIYPPPEVRARLVPQLADSLQYQRLLTRSWTRIRTGR